MNRLHLYISSHSHSFFTLRQEQVTTFSTYPCLVTVKLSFHNMTESSNPASPDCAAFDGFIYDAECLLYRGKVPDEDLYIMVKETVVAFLQSSD